MAERILAGMVLPWAIKSEFSNFLPDDTMITAMKKGAFDES
jgi:hypothetical protein